MRHALEISVVSVAYGYAMALYLHRRNHSPRDSWYALFLALLATTQVFDIVFWGMRDYFGNLPCTDANMILSRYGIPMIFFWLLWGFTVYPAENSVQTRVFFRVLAFVGTVALAVTSGCTSVKYSTGVLKGPSLIYGGAMPTALGMGIATLIWVMGVALFVRPYWAARNITVVGFISILMVGVLDGSWKITSKILLHHILLSVIWLSEPCAGPVHHLPFSNKVNVCSKLSCTDGVTAGGTEKCSGCGDILQLKGGQSVCQKCATVVPMRKLGSSLPSIPEDSE